MPVASYIETVYPNPTPNNVTIAIAIICTAITSTISKPDAVRIRIVNVLECIILYSLVASHTA